MSTHLEQLFGLLIVYPDKTEERTVTDAYEAHEQGKWEVAHGAVRYQVWRIPLVGERPPRHGLTR